MAIKVYGSLEEFQRANIAPEPAYMSGMRTPSMPPLSGCNNDKNIHIVPCKAQSAHNSSSSSSSSINNNQGVVTANQQTGVSSPSIWERRRQFRRSVLSSLTRWFPGGKDNADGEARRGDGSDEGGQITRRAQTTVTGGTSSKPRSNSLMFRRASTSAVQK